MYENVEAQRLRGGREAARLDHIPDECPICHSRVDPAIRHVAKMDKENRSAEIRVCYRCPSQRCQELFVGYYRHSVGGSVSNLYKLSRTAPRQPKQLEFSEEITSLSPSFVEIYNQGLAAESSGLHQVVGIALRKALEFLIKDFLIDQNPEKKEDIEKLFLGRCIKKYVNDQNIKQCAERAIWLGNDEAHYIRKWEDKDIGDMKTLVRLTVNWIESNLLTQRYISEMEA